MSKPQSEQIVLEGHFTPEQAGQYHNVPFDMPPGIVRIDVRYEYSAQIASDPELTGGNTLDIGLFDQRGADYPGAGFRGLTGSARSEFFVSLQEATPGYLAGPLEPGRWHLTLGFYKSAKDGCYWRATIDLQYGDKSPDDSLYLPMLTVENSRSTLEARESGWYRGELHCHTFNSDGDSSPEAMIAQALSLGFDFLAITDHNSVSHLAAQAKLGPQPLVLIPGCEVTAYKGHWNVWGLEEWIDFRTLTPDLMAQSIQRAVDHGYLTSLNHPRPYGPDWEFKDVVRQHCMEVWNGPWAMMNDESLAYWESLLRSGRKLVAVGGSDAHYLKKSHPAQIGTPTTWIYCPGEPTAAALLASLRAGHAFITDAPDGPQLYLRNRTAMMGDTLMRPATGMVDLSIRVVDGAGLTLELHGSNGLLQSVAIADNVQTVDTEILVDNLLYVRVQLVEPGRRDLTVRALSNPIYFQ